MTTPQSQTRSTPSSLGPKRLDKDAGDVAAAGQPAPRLRGGLPFFGHMLPFAKNPYHFMQRAHDECGEVVEFTMLGSKIVLLTGEVASEAFYRAPDEQLDQSAAYRLMAPIFGEGLVFDAPIERKNEQLKMLMPSLRFDAMRNHSAKIVDEVHGMVEPWEKQVERGGAGEVELVEFMKELTIRTASHCLLGREFRYELSEEFASIYHDLEQGVHPLAYHYPNFPIPTFRRRDKARARLQELVSGIIASRKEMSEKPDDMFQHLLETTYADGTPLTENEITGMLVAVVFAGHHTSSGTAAWVLLELLKQPALLQEVRDELDGIYGGEENDGEITFQSLRQIPKLEAVVKEVLRLHPPLIVLMRQVSQDLRVGPYVIPKGRMVWASPPVTHRIASLFPEPQRFDPSRYAPGRAEDKNVNAYQPFGGGRHKCSGNAFAIFQIKAIFAILLREWEFELVDAPETYVDDYTQMIVQPIAPSRVRYRRRQRASAGASAEQGTLSATQASPQPVRYRAILDADLCQGHAMCVGDAPEIFSFEGDQASVQPGGFDLGLLEKARDAEEHCPTRAIRVEAME